MINVKSREKRLFLFQYQNFFTLNNFDSKLFKRKLLGTDFLSHSLLKFFFNDLTEKKFEESQVLKSPQSNDLESFRERDS